MSESVYFADGFESASILKTDTPAGLWDSSFTLRDASVSLVSSPVRSGNYALKLHLSSAAEIHYAGISKDITSMGWHTDYIRTYFQIPSTTPLPILGNPLFLLYTTGTILLCAVLLFRNTPTDYQFSAYNNLGPSGLSANMPFTYDRWYCLEHKVFTDPVNGEHTVWLDGNQIATNTGNYTNEILTSSRLENYDAGGGFPNGITVYYDDAVIDPNYIGPAKVNSIVPAGTVTMTEQTNNDIANCGARLRALHRTTTLSPTIIG